MRRNDQPSRPNAMTCSRFSLLKTWLMTTEGNFPPRRLCLKPSLYGCFSLDHQWPDWVITEAPRGQRCREALAAWSAWPRRLRSKAAKFRFGIGTRCVPLPPIRPGWPGTSVEYSEYLYGNTLTAPNPSAFAENSGSFMVNLCTSLNRDTRQFADRPDYAGTPTQHPSFSSDRILAANPAETWP